MLHIFTSRVVSSNATGHLKGMTIYGTITAVLNLALSIALVKSYGIAGVIAGTVIAFAVANYIPTFIEVRSVWRKYSAQQRLTRQSAFVCNDFIAKLRDSCHEISPLFGHCALRIFDRECCH